MPRRSTNSGKKPGSNTSSQRRRPEAPSRSSRRMKRKVCSFCTEKSEYIDYKNYGMLRKYVSDRGKIRARRVTGNCPRHQREVANAVKNAREMALLPYVGTHR